MRPVSPPDFVLNRLSIQVLFAIPRAFHVMVAAFQAGFGPPIGVVSARLHELIAVPLVQSSTNL